MMRCGDGVVDFRWCLDVATYVSVSEARACLVRGPISRGKAIKRLPWDAFGVFYPERCDECGSNHACGARNYIRMARLFESSPKAAAIADRASISALLKVVAKCADVDLVDLERLALLALVKSKSPAPACDHTEKACEGGQTGVFCSGSERLPPLRVDPAQITKALRALSRAARMDARSR